MKTIFFVSKFELMMVAELFDAIDELPDRCKEIFKRSYVDGQRGTEDCRRVEYPEHDKNSKAASKVFPQEGWGICSFMRVCFPGLMILEDYLRGTHLSQRFDRYFIYSSLRL